MKFVEAFLDVIKWLALLWFVLKLAGCISVSHGMRPRGELQAWACDDDPRSCDEKIAQVCNGKIVERSTSVFRPHNQTIFVCEGELE